VRTILRAGLAASLVLATIAFAPRTNTQLFDADRQHLRKTDADSAVVAAAFARDAGSVTAALPGTVSGQPCVDGAAGVFACDGVDMLSFIPLASFASTNGEVEASDIWGWTDPVTADEIVLLGTTAASRTRPMGAASGRTSRWMVTSRTSRPSRTTTGCWCST
jgi:hypothetical protein